MSPSASDTWTTVKHIFELHTHHSFAPKDSLAACCKQAPPHPLCGDLPHLLCGCLAVKCVAILQQIWQILQFITIYYNNSSADQWQSVSDETTWEYWKDAVPTACCSWIHGMPGPGNAKLNLGAVCLNMKTAVHSCGLLDLVWLVYAKCNQNWPYTHTHTCIEYQWSLYSEQVSALNVVKNLHITFNARLYTSKNIQW